MSDKLKRRVRQLMAQTGMTYQAALNKLRNDERKQPPPPSDSDAPGGGA